MLHFELLGFPVRVEPMFWLIALLLGANLGSPPMVVIWIAVVFLSVLIHELGHAIAFQAQGHAPDITLTSFGGYTSPRGPRLSHAQNIWVSFAGPLAQLMVWGGLMSVATFAGLPANEYVRAFYLYMIIVNLYWPLINLVPLLPLDGGHIMESTVYWISKRPNRDLVLKISIATGVAATLYALTSRQFWLAMLAGWMTYNSYTELQNNSRFGPRFYS